MSDKKSVRASSFFVEMVSCFSLLRIGTILELVRSIAIKLLEQNLRVRICVQGSMGVGIFTGVPKQLNGVARLLQMMDWQSEEGEENEARGLPQGTRPSIPPLVIDNYGGKCRSLLKGWLAKAHSLTLNTSGTAW